MTVSSAGPPRHIQDVVVSEIHSMKVLNVLRLNVKKKSKARGGGGVKKNLKLQTALSWHLSFDEQLDKSCCY